MQVVKSVAVKDLMLLAWGTEHVQVVKSVAEDLMLPGEDRTSASGRVCMSA